MAAATRNDSLAPKIQLQHVQQMGEDFPIMLICFSPAKNLLKAPKRSNGEVRFFAIITTPLEYFTGFRQDHGLGILPEFRVFPVFLLILDPSFREYHLFLFSSNQKTEFGGNIFQ
jgi:hypothetical protein